jgi:ATP synthase protein I
VQKLVRVQCLLCLLCFVVAQLAFGSAVAYSALYGGLCAAAPVAVVALGWTYSPLTKMLSRFAQGALMSFAFWELVKVVLTLVGLCLAPKLLANLNWLALVAGFVVVLKAYLIQAFIRPTVGSF